MPGQLAYLYSTATVDQEAPQVLMILRGPHHDAVQLDATLAVLGDRYGKSIGIFPDREVTHESVPLLVEDMMAFIPMACARCPVTAHIIDWNGEITDEYYR
jgi:hypothetical protein